MGTPPYLSASISRSVLQVRGDIEGDSKIILVEPACGERDLVVTIVVQHMCMHYAWLRASICLDLSGPSFLHLCRNF